MTPSPPRKVRSQVMCGALTWCRIYSKGRISMSSAACLLYSNILLYLYIFRPFSAVLRFSYNFFPLFTALSLLSLHFFFFFSPVLLQRGFSLFFTLIFLVFFLLFFLSLLLLLMLDFLLLMDSQFNFSQ